MKLKITPDQHDAFLKALQKAETITRTRSPLPIISCLLITAEDESVSIHANNLDQAITIQAKAEVVKKGQICIAGRDLLRAAGLGTTIEIEEVKNEAIIRCNGLFRIPLLPASDFPSLPDVSKSTTTKLTGEELRKILACSYAAADPKGARYILQGVCLNLEAKQGVACDGRRLAISSYPVAEKGWGVAIPDTACRLIVPLLQKGEIFELSMAASAASVSGARFTFYTRLIEGEYPNFRQTIPKHVFAMKLKRNDLIAAIDRVLVAQSDINKLALSFSPTKITLNVVGMNANAETTLEYSEPPPAKAKDFKISVDHRFLREAAVAMDDDILSLEFIDSTSPMAVKADSYAIIMPLRIQ